jgi:hypothetical protein
LPGIDELEPAAAAPGGGGAPQALADRGLVQAGLQQRVEGLADFAWLPAEGLKLFPGEVGGKDLGDAFLGD